MEQLLQLSISLIAILVVSLFAWRLFPKGSPLTRQRVQSDVERASYGAKRASDIVLTKDKESALAKVVDLAGKDCGLAVIATLGTGSFVRFFEYVDLKASANTFTLNIRDVTQPKIQLDFKDDDFETANSWLNKIQRIQNEGSISAL